MVTSDFHVQYTGKSIVKASNLSDIKPHILTLSNFDLLSGRYPVTVFYAYRKPQQGDFSCVVTVIKSSLSESLQHFYPFSGRIVLNSITGEPEILCNNEGVEVIEAHADINLENIDFHNLNQSLQKNLVPFPHEIPLRLQITSYTCGGFSVSWSFDHALADGTAFDMFLVLWSEIAQKKPISKYPDHRRSIFRPRSPPTYGTFVDRTFTRCTMDEVLNTPMTRDISHKKLYYIEASDVDRLQDLASKDGHKRTKIEAFSAYVWKVLATAVEEESGMDTGTVTHCKMGWLVDGRRRMSDTHKNVSRLVGNAVSMAVGNASVRDLKENSLSDVAGVAHEAITEVTNEAHFLDLIDWIECHRPGLVLAKLLLGIEGPTVIVSSGRQFPMKEMDLGFGSPMVGTCYSTIRRLGAGFVYPHPSARGDGSWFVFTMVWPKLAAALESDNVFRPVTANHYG